MAERPKKIARGSYRYFVSVLLNIRVTKWALLALIVIILFSLGYILDPFNQSPLRLVGQVKSYVNAVPYPFVAFVLFTGIASLALIPINILLIAAALIFPGWKGFFCGLLGALLATLLEYTVGRYFVSAEFLESHLSDRFKALKKRISQNGLAAITFLALVPVAPHIINNLVAGVCRIKVSDLLIGSTIGLIPGLLVINIVGRSVRHFIAQPNLLTAGVVLLVLIAMIGIMRLIRVYISRRHRDHEVSPVH